MRSGNLRAIAAVVVAAASVVGLPTPVDAECNPPGADLSFRRRCRWRPRIVVGTIAEVRPDGLPMFRPDGSSTRFTVAVEHVLRGDEASTVAFEQAETGGCIRWLSAAVGDRIAAAIDVRAADPTIRRPVLSLSGWRSPPG